MNCNNTINCHKPTAIVKHSFTLPPRLLYDPIFKVRSFASSVFISFLGFGWKRVAINSGPKNPKDLLKKRRVRCHKLPIEKKNFVTIPGSWIVVQPVIWLKNLCGSKILVQKLWTFLFSL
ncbi:hypothetical protein TNCV_4458121 [Trichonephila clavipes]|nr:hypothetical protein TNCV_4458121 [Trichonephila clavipes]